MRDSNTVESAYTLYRHLQLYCSHPTKYRREIIGFKFYVQKAKIKGRFVTKITMVFTLPNTKFNFSLIFLSSENAFRIERSRVFYRLGKGSTLYTHYLDTAV